MFQSVRQQEDVSALGVLVLCLHLIRITSLAAAGPARQHEARQGGAISVEPFSQGPGPVPLQLTSSTLTSTTTMSPASSSEPSAASSSTSSSQLHSSTSTSSALSSSSPSKASASSTTSSTAPHASPTPGSINFTVQNMTTCNTSLISWNYSGTAAQLFLSITNITVDDSASSIKARATTASSTLQQQLVATNTSAQSWTWPSVNVTQGWYEIEALVLTSPNLSNNSAPFFVSNGTNVSCLIATSTSAKASSTPSAASVTSKTNVAAIVGGVVGGVVVLVLVIIAGVCLLKRKKRFVRSGGNKNGQWGSLKSAHSSIQPNSGVRVTTTHFHTRSESSGATFQGDAAGKTSAITTPQASVENVAVTAEEKLASPASSLGMGPSDALNTPIHYHYERRASVYTTPTPTSATDESTWSRSTTRRVSNQSLDQQAQRIRCSMETPIARHRSERLSMPTLPSPSLSRIPQSPMLAQPKEEYALSPIAATPVNRSVSAGAVSMTTRRASRKPVPQYDPSLLEDNADARSTFTAGAESSHSGRTGGAHGPELSHKTSFGDGRPLHYLIPDMPPPQPEN